jgi:hypothetical protein
MPIRKYFFIFSFALFYPFVVFGGVKNSTVYVYSNGDVSLRNAEIVQIIGPTIVVKTVWDDAYIRWIVRTDSGGDIRRMFGGVSGVSEMKLGHILNIEGKLLSGADSLNIIARNIVNTNIENEENQVFSGIVSEIYPGNSGVELQTQNKTVALKISNNLSIPKGKRFITVSDLRKGDKIVSAKGTYHPPTNTLFVESMEVYEDTSIFKPRNFQGKLKSLNATSSPTVAVIVVGEKEYNVYLSPKTEVFNSKRKPTTLARFVLGDTVRFYGSIRETDLLTIDAEIIRNLDL